MIPCIHRGEATRVEHQKFCPGKGKTVPVFTCAVHGECSERYFAGHQRKQKHPVWACIGCFEYEPVKQE
jgi:hypothetical protein